MQVLSYQGVCQAQSVVHFTGIVVVRCRTRTWWWSVDDIDWRLHFSSQHQIVRRVPRDSVCWATKSSHNVTSQSRWCSSTTRPSCCWVCDETVQQPHWSRPCTLWYVACRCLAVCKPRSSTDHRLLCLCRSGSRSAHRICKWPAQQQLLQLTASLFGTRNASVHFVNGSTQVTMKTDPRLDFGWGPVKSTWRRSNGAPVTIGCSGADRGNWPR